MKIVVLDGNTLNPGDLSWDKLKEIADVKVYDDTAQIDKEIIDRIGNAQIVLTNKVCINKKIMEEAKNLKYIGVLATGYNNIDIEYAKQKSIKVSNVNNYGTFAVAQFAIALLLEITSRVGHHALEVRKNRWQESGNWTFRDYPLIELQSKTMGIIGFGNIGKRIGIIANSLGMKVIATNSKKEYFKKDFYEMVSLDELLERSDVINLSCPLNERTRDIINNESIKKMKDGVIIINTARGKLIDEQALINAIKTKKIFACGLDVSRNEPIEENNELLNLENVFITPHIAWAAKETRQKLLDIAIDNVESYINGKPKNLIF